MTLTPISLISRTERSIRTNFEGRMAEVRRDYLRFLAHEHPEPSFDVRELAAELLTMPDMERFTLLRRVVGHTSGPGSLEGLEALHSFISSYMLDDGECMVVPEPDPAEIDEDPGFAMLLHLVRHDEDNEHLSDEALREKALALHAEQERPLVVIQASADAKSARPVEILAAIAHNRDLARRRAAEFEDFMSDEAPSSPGL